MGRRGRPPYPDILTPRQWEVLDLVRRGLSDQEIADALDLTLAGAKYHVSEILTKLGVASREEAAAWQPAEARQSWWRRALALSLAAKVIGVTIVVAALAGVGLLTWGALRSDDSGNVTAAAVFDDLALPSPITPPTLTREQALVRGGQGAYGDVRAVDVQVSTMDGILAATDSGQVPGIHPETAWLVRIRSVADALPPGAFYPCCTAPSPDVACREIDISFLDTMPPPGSDPTVSEGGMSVRGAISGGCSPQFSPDLAIALAAKQFDELLDYFKPNPVLADRITAEKTLAGAALATMQKAGIASNVQVVDDGSSVYLVTFGGRLAVRGSPTPVPIDPPSPGPAVVACRIAMAIVSQDGVGAAGSAPSTDC